MTRKNETLIEVQRSENILKQTFLHSFFVFALISALQMSPNKAIAQQEYEAKLELTETFFNDAWSYLPEKFIKDVVEPNTLSSENIRNAVRRLNIMWDNYLKNCLGDRIDSRLVDRISLYCTIEFVKTLTKMEDGFIDVDFYREFAESLSSVESWSIDDFFVLSGFVTKINTKTKFFTVIENIVTLLQLYHDEFYRDKWKHSKLLFDAVKFLSLFSNPLFQKTYSNHQELANSINLDELFDEFYKDPFSNPPRIDNEYLSGYLDNTSVQEWYWEALWDASIILPSFKKDITKDQYTQTVDCLPASIYKTDGFDYASASFIFGIVYDKDLWEKNLEKFYFWWINTHILETHSKIYNNPNVLQRYPTSRSLPIDTTINTHLLERKEFIRKIYEWALDAAEKLHLPVSFVLAHAVLESGWGMSDLSKNWNNYFGMKWLGKSYQTHEYVDWKKITKKSSFAHFDSPNDCFLAYIDRLNNPRYQRELQLLSFEQRVIPSEVAKALWRAGYYTSPIDKYSNKVKSVSLFISRYIIEWYKDIVWE